MRPITLRAAEDFEHAFEQVRIELDVPRRFPEDVEAEAEAAPDPLTNPSGGQRTGDRTRTDRVDARHLPLVAIDPPGATDLDQAFSAERLNDGYRVHYAIADIGAFVTPGGAVDREARQRGTTLYCPDFRAPLHPTILSEDRASLLPGGEKPALLWTIDLDRRAEPVEWRFEPAVVRVREAITYREAQSRVDTGAADGVLTLLAEIGPLRQAREAERGGVSLRVPAQEIVRQGNHYVLEYDRTLPVEGWNAQISLLAGMIAGRAMYEAGIGVLRTLPPADDTDVARLRRMAGALGLDWPTDKDYADFVRTIHPTTAAQNAFLVQCTRLFRGAGYHSFDGQRPDQPEHGAIAAVYAHVTAPLRRLVDRFGNEIVLALSAGHTPPAWALEGLDELPSLMGQARRRESSLERALLDTAEVLVLEHHIGSTFDAVVVDVIEGRSRARVQIPDPAVVADVGGDGLDLADQVKLRLAAVDRTSRSVSFEPLR